MTQLQIRLLGDFQIFQNDHPVDTINWARVQSLLGYLLLHREASISRQNLAFLLWPDSDEAQARTNLRVLLHRLRKDFPHVDTFIDFKRATVGWRRDAPYLLDVATFEAAQAQAEAATGTAALVHLKQAVAAYGGDLLPDLYDEWILVERERLHNRFLLALTRLVDLLETERCYAEAIEYAQRLLAADPLREAAHRRLMQLHVANDDRAAALQVYHTCATLLERELGVPPSVDMRHLYERLLVRSVQLPDVFPQRQVLAIPLVGRQSEWQQLQRAWRQAITGQTQMVLIWGEAGMGKTRLAEELLDYVHRQGYTTATTRSYAAEGTLAYAPVSEWLRTPALRAAVERLEDLWRLEVARLLPEVLVDRPDLPRPGPLYERWQHQRFYTALVRAVQRAPQPLLLHIDDLQWSDPETLAWLHYLLRSQDLRLLIVGTARVEEVDDGHPLHTLLHSLRREQQVLEMEVGPLDVDETIALAEQTAGNALSSEVRTQLWQQSQGYPLFVVERVRAELSMATGEVGSKGASETSIPPAGSPAPLPPIVHNVITARLGQLSSLARRIADLAAVVGRSIPYAVLHTASDLAEEELIAGIDELWQRRILREQDEGYDFSHDIIRQTTYRSISHLQRRLLHGRVARAMEQDEGARRDEMLGQMAVQFDHAGLPAQAAVYYHQAAETAQRLSANSEAIAYLRRGLLLLNQIPETERSIRLELRMQLSLGYLLVFLKGRPQEAEHAYRRALSLCDRVEEPLLRFRSLVGLSTYYQGQGKHRRTHELAQQALQLAEEAQDLPLQIQAHDRLGVSDYYLGQFARSRKHFERVLQLAGNADVSTPELEQARLRSLGFLARDLWLLGYPDQARSRCREALQIAERLPYAHGLFFALPFVLRAYQYCRDVETVERLAQRMLALATEGGFTMRAGQAKQLLGWAMVAKNQLDEGIATLRQGIEEWQGAGATTHVPEGLTQLAEAYRQRGDIEMGLESIAMAETMLQHSEEAWWGAELYRIKAELLSIQSYENRDQAKAVYTEALDIARRQQARSLELRSAMGLARLLLFQGERHRAHDLVAPIYAWFREGFDTPDLIEAKQLLGKLRD